MQIVRSGSLLVLVLGCVIGVNAQDTSSTAAQPASRMADTPSVSPSQSAGSLPPAAVTLNDVVERVVQREHLERQMNTL